jgi:predicted RecA/RadA family phage recombinase
MKNNVVKGERITWTNSTGSAVVSGQLVRVGVLLAVASTNIAIGATGELEIGEVYTVPKKSSDTITQGQALAYDQSAANLTNNLGAAASGDLTGVAIAYEAAAASTTTVKAWLPVTGGGVLTP